MNPVLSSALRPLFALLLLLSTSALAETCEELVAKGDIYYDKLQPAEALKYYLPAEKLDPKNVSLLVKIARQYRHLLSEAKSDTEKLRYGKTATDYADRAVALAPEDPEAQLAVAISYGKVLPYESSRGQVNGSRTVKAAAEKVVRLDPKNDLGWHVLGRWHLVVSEVGGMKKTLGALVYGKLPPASLQEAERCFQKAIARNPNRLMHYIELGRTYADMGRAEDAKKYINKGLAMKNTEKDDPETKEKGREVLAKLGKS
jgi:tetratricopeptide (TPR) repeat protein